MNTLIALAFVALPFLDIASLIKAGSLFGFLPTVGLVLGAGLLGTWLVRHQGLTIGRSVQATLAAGRLPVVEAFDGACLLIAGGLLLFPGLVSDVVALALLIPGVRAALRRMLARRMREKAATVVWTSGPGGIPQPMAGGDVIDADYEVVRSESDSPSPTRAASPAALPPGSAEPPTIVRPKDPC